MDIHFAVFLCFKTLRVAEIDPNRFYVWPVPLDHLKNTFQSIFIEWLSSYIKLNIIEIHKTNKIEN